jgi:hypothetical protein
VTIRCEPGQSNADPETVVVFPVGKFDAHCGRGNTTTYNGGDVKLYHDHYSLGPRSGFAFNEAVGTVLAIEPKKERFS